MTYDEIQAMLDVILKEIDAAYALERDAAAEYRRQPSEEARVKMLHAEARWQRAQSARYAAWAERTLALIKEPAKGRWAPKPTPERLRLPAPANRAGSDDAF